jgi:hypothetical protein
MRSSSKSLALDVLENDQNPYAQYKTLEDVACFSLNLTQSGMVGNLEAFEAMEIVGPDCPPGICAQVLSFLEELGGLWAEDQKEHLPALRILAALQSQLKKTAGDISPLATETFFLTSFGGSFPDQLFARIGKVSSMHVASPYFGASIKGLKLLTETLRPEEVSVYPAIPGRPHSAHGQP